MVVICPSCTHAESLERIPANEDRREERDEENPIKRMTQKTMTLYRPQKRVKSLFWGLHKPVEKVVKISKERFAALRKMVGW